MTAKCVRDNRLYVAHHDGLCAKNLLVVTLSSISFCVSGGVLSAFSAIFSNSLQSL